jgi:hypothetical protein
MIMSIVSVRENPQTFPMRYRMLRLALNSPTVDSLLVNDSQMRTNLLQKMLTETDHNTSFREEMSRAVQRHESLMTDIKKDLKVK